jgi:hypothetical protein
MNRLLVMASLAGALALPMLAAPTTASASCADRKATGTILGGVGGALIGNSISGGGGGAILGGLGGAVVGHQIAASGCGRYRSSGYRSSGYRYYREDEPSRAVRYVYYDQYGQPVSQGAVEATPVGYGGTSSSCRTETQAYYDDRGALVRRPVQVCAR